MLKYIQYSEMYINSFRTELSQFLNKKKSREWFDRYHFYFKNKEGFEVGGPSPLFSKDVLPVYELSKSIDGCNFSSTTVWEGNIVSEDYCYFKSKKGRQFISEGSDLTQVKDEQYDFLLSCHNLEHIANPIKAVKEWQRVVRKGGVLLLVLPEKRFTFDKKRPFTSFNHLLEDFISNIPESDLTHLPEVLKLHHLKLDPNAGRNYDKFVQRCVQNFENRCLHHHVFNQDVLRRVFEYLDIEVIAQKFVPSIHQIIIGKK